MTSELLRKLVDPIKGMEEYQKIQKRDDLRRLIWNAQERVLAPAKYEGPPIQLSLGRMEPQMNLSDISIKILAHIPEDIVYLVGGELHAGSRKAVVKIVNIANRPGSAIYRSRKAAAKRKRIADRLADIRAKTIPFGQFQVVSYWSGELLDWHNFNILEMAEACAKALNRELSIDAVVRSYDPDRPL